MSSTIAQKTSTSWEWRIWWQWVLANAVGEMVGLGTTLLIGAFLLVQAEPIIGAIPAYRAPVGLLQNINRCIY